MALAMMLASCLSVPLMGAGDPGPGAETPTHPIITEVLFNVPTGPGGDANKDSKRDATGDEFVELFNPTSRAISLRGYRLANRLAAGDRNAKKGFSFVFPACELAPGELAVVFNGQDATIPGPVGTGATAATPNPNFHNARVFRVAGSGGHTSGFKNDGDWLVLESPDGKAVQLVSWGEPDPAPPPGSPRDEHVKAKVKGSVQRVKTDGPLVEHQTINAELFSPGAMPTEKAGDPAAAPTPAPQVPPSGAAPPAQDAPSGKSKSKPRPRSGT